MHLHGLHRGLEVGCEEWFRACEAIHLKRIISDCQGESVSDEIEHGEHFFVEQESNLLFIRWFRTGYNKKGVAYSLSFLLASLW